MTNAVEIQKCFAGLVGFFQPDDPTYDNIDTSLTTSLSGKYIQTTHPLCTLENLSNCAPQFDTFTYPAWDNAQNYSVNTRVVFSGDVYQSKTPVVSGGTDPATNTDGWAKIDPFSEWLNRIYKSSCDKITTELLKFKKIKNVGRSILDSQRLYDGFGLPQDRIVKRGRFVGMELSITRIESIQIRLDQIGFQFDTAQTIELYIYHSSRKQPIAIVPVVLEGGSSFEWHDQTNLILSYLSKMHDTTGRFYIGYYEDDIDGQAINRLMNISRPCYGCSGYNVNAFNSWSKFLKINTFEVPETALNVDKSLFDLTKISYSTDTNYGLNFSITALCDMTAFFCKNKMLFADALAMQTCLDLLQEIAFNTRINYTSDKIKATAAAELDPDPKSGSFRALFVKSIMALDLDFSGFDSSCLPCNTRSISRRIL